MRSLVTSKKCKLAPFNLAHPVWYTGGRDQHVSNQAVYSITGLHLVPICNAQRYAFMEYMMKMYKNA